MPLVPATSSPLVSSANVLDTGNGLLTQSFDISVIQNAQLLVSGTIYGFLIGLRAGDVVTNVITNMTVAGATFTLAKVGLYDVSGNRLATSADVQAGYSGATGFVSSALTSPYTATTTAAVYAVAIAVATTTPTLIRGAGTLSPAAIGSGARRQVVQSGQADLGATQTFSATNNGIWFGVN